ncbi:hypothetical protein SAMN06297129_0227 [Pseudooceanicola antarcticus]|uniref:Yip1 domain-containing protein n=1 Tax=Pseudooceanicola antarcticus TaxID=1247613 RepID=A0A285HQ95_9RHOB|nr:hypothetical protein [Pseudooceanicola antarcticus]PJE27808.1 hypothetical protein CVM39_14645 [Pseudooceanicola antarcticus]SNY36861.1 hypothetical protein SAMN06297129_0227 [Pseudooceanicola antarcticus]
MLEKLIETYRSFFNIIVFAVETPRQFYRRLVEEIGLPELLGFYLQVVVVMLAFNRVVFDNGEQADGGQFDIFAMAIGAMDLLLMAGIVAVVFWALLRLTGGQERLSHVAKFIVVIEVFMGIVTLVVSTLTTYIGFALTDGYAFMSDFPTEEPPLMGWLHAIDHYVVPILLLSATLLLLWLSSGRSPRVVLALLVALAVQVVVLGPLLNMLWLQILSVHYPPPAI